MSKDSPGHATHHVGLPIIWYCLPLLVCVGGLTHDQKELMEEERSNDLQKVVDALKSIEEFLLGASMTRSGSMVSDFGIHTCSYTTV